MSSESADSEEQEEEPAVASITFSISWMDENGQIVKQTSSEWPDGTRLRDVFLAEYPNREDPQMNFSVGEIRNAATGELVDEDIMDVKYAYPFHNSVTVICYSMGQMPPNLNFSWFHTIRQPHWQTLRARLA